MLVNFLGILGFTFSSRHLKTMIMQTVAWQRMPLNLASPCSVLCLCVETTG